MCQPNVRRPETLGCTPCSQLAWAGRTWPNPSVRPEDLRAFARRDWPRVARAKLAYWTKQYEEHAAAPSLRAAAALRAHVVRFARDSLQAQRALDLADHVTLKRRIDAARLGFHH